MFPQILVVLQRIDMEVRKAVDEAVKVAKTEPEPPVDDMYHCIYSELPPGGPYVVRGSDISIQASSKVSS